MFSHPLTKELEAFWRTHAGRHKDPLWQKYLSVFGPLLLDKLTEMSEAHSNDGRFGMSKAGGCTRAASLAHLGHEADLTGSTRATFAIGHLIEVMALATFSVLGYPLTNVQKRVAIEPMMSSSIDGQTVLNGVPTIISVKSAAYKMSGYNYKARTWKRYGFCQFPLDGLKATNPGYWAQAQAEQHALGIKQTLLIVVAKDIIKKMQDDPILKDSGSLTFYTELVPHDPVFVEKSLIPVWEKQWRDVREGNPGRPMYLTRAGRYTLLVPGDKDANKAATASYNPCDYCDFVDACTERKLHTELVASLEAANAL